MNLKQVCNDREVTVELPSIVYFTLLYSTFQLFYIIFIQFDFFLALCLSLSLFVISIYRLVLGVENKLENKNF